MRIVVTGASGFVGQALCRRLVADGHSVIATIRSPESMRAVPAGISAIFNKPLAPETDWSDAICGADVVVHLAARVHVMHEAAADSLSEFRCVNVDGTYRLAQAALACRVRRFVFLSSIKVNGEATPYGKSFSELDQPLPQDPYGISKLETEQALRSVSGSSLMEAVIMRPPLVYGPGVAANALRLFAAVHNSYPLPLASVHNLRSLIYLNNLVDAISLCCVHPRAAAQTYLVSDRDDVSTPELIRRIAAALGVSPRLVPFPPVLLSLAGAVLGRRASLSRLLGSLLVDSSKIGRDLGWSPPFTMQQGLAATAKWFLSRNESS